MSVTANKIAFELNNTFKQILKNSKAVDKQLIETKVTEFKNKLESEVLKNLNNLEIAYDKLLKLRKFNDSDIQKKLDQIKKIKDEKKIFEDIFIEDRIESPIKKVKLTFVSPMAKEMLKLHNDGSGTLQVPTTKIVFLTSQKLREYFGGLQIIL